MDIFSRKIMEHELHETESMENSSPSSRHEDEDLEILKRRHAVYQEAQKQLPFSLVWTN